MSRNCRLTQARVAVDPQHAEALDGGRRQVGPLIEVQHHVPQKNRLKLGGLLRLRARPTENVFDRVVVEVRPLLFAWAWARVTSPGQGGGIDEDADTAHNQQIGENLDAEEGVHVQAALVHAQVQPGDSRLVGGRSRRAGVMSRIRWKI